ncbi:glycoside hydrolase family 3 protein [Colwellia hornerae]|uniref:Glycoside hydrolase family 3 protein n=2 Tax=Colwellia hornerae TaxID=89402 RepID=A0A5C6QEL4_9GAMM|nr:exo 1,3/1,4-beta-D-glucan glucohydrolase [Colwellia hornerae]TWX52611.1 glycoside hydrolase family 3 protein [Colwellia hornerae]TWX58374.1 glycoside hydrolase family 3 protein [Colwellia hornerae]TWX67426.1 glycoside hydrolase family 3 protein [Colwellia hornerae]
MNVIKYLTLNKKNCFLITLSLLTLGCSPAENSTLTGQEIQAIASNKADKIWPKLESDVKKDAQVEQKVANLLAEMTLQQKVAQMIQPEIRDITLEDMRTYGFGSYLNGGGGFPNNNKHSTPADWVLLAEKMYQASIDDSLDGSTIPTMWGTDAVHGHNNVIGATLFPHNIGLGAANNPKLIEKIAEITATEVMVTGIDWVFAPTVAVVRDDRWGRSYEGYSEDPEIVRTYSAAVVKGLQGHANKDFLGDKRVISSIKHFIGDGGTQDGDDQGDNIASEQELFTVHAQGYVGGLTAGAQSVMASFNSWHGDKVHGHKYLLTDVLKNRMGFDGFVVGDWNGHGQVKGCIKENCAQAVNAGLDIFMVPTQAWRPLYDNIIAQVKQGDILQSRIDDAVTRILRVKVRAGLFEKPSPAKRVLSGNVALMGAESHREVARQAVRESLVLLKNNGQLLPLSPKQDILVAGDAADNIGKQSGGWSITWQGTGNKNADFIGGSSIYSGIEQQVSAAGGQVTLSVDGSYTNKPDVAIVVFGEEPYAEGHGDIDNLEYQRGDKKDLALLNSFKAKGIPVVAVFISGRPLWVNAELNASNAFVAAWLPGSEGKAIADVLLRSQTDNVQHDFTGKLSFSWPKSPTQIVNRFDDDYQALFSYGYGLTYQDDDILLADLSEQSTVVLNTHLTTDVFLGKAIAPWSMLLFSQQQNIEIESSSESLAGIFYRTVDKDIQEDSFRLKTTGAATAGVKFINTNGFREDLSKELQMNAALTFSVKRDSDINAPVYITMNCETTGDSASCQASYNIQAQLAVSKKGEWQTVAISLHCFAEKGLLLSKIAVPFELSTSGAVNLSINHIRLVEDKAASAPFKCPQ